MAGTAPDTTEGPAAEPGLALVECLGIGSGTILHNRESGALLATNAFGAMLFDALRAAPSAEAATRALAAELAIAEDEVGPAAADTFARWREAGLFLSAPPPFPAPLAYRPAGPSADPRHFGLGTRHVVIASEDAVLAADVARALAPMQLHRADPAPGTAVRLDVLTEDSGLGVFRDGQAVWGAAGYELSRFHLLREVMDALAGPERIAAQLHAGAVARAGRALVFAGASGSGKSTLAAILTAASAELVADDHTALATDARHLLAFPTRPNLKPGAFALPELQHWAGAQEYIPARIAPAGAEIALAGFVFPEYAADADNALDPLDKTEALQRLIRTGSRVSRTTRSIAPLVAALGAVPTLRLTYRDTGFARAACERLLDG